MKTIIAGHPRGGTTWFAHLLRAHPKLRLVLEPFNHTRNQSMELHGLRGEIIHRLGEWRRTGTDVYGRIRRRLGRGVLDRYAAACCEYERNLPWVPSAALTEAQRQALAAMVNVFFQATQADGFKAVWAGLKLPPFYEIVRTLDLDTRLIFLQRDFTGVLASCHRRDFWYWFERPHRNLYAHYPSLSPDCRLIADAFRDWTLPPQRLYTCWLVFNYSDIQDTERCGGLVIRYSDLTQDCLTTMETALRYLGLKMPPTYNTPFGTQIAMSAITHTMRGAIYLAFCMRTTRSPLLTMTCFARHAAGRWRCEDTSAGPSYWRHWHRDRTAALVRP